MAKSAMKLARVLTAWPAVNAAANDLLEADASLIDALAMCGAVDSCDEAVAYAQSCGARVARIEDPAAAAAVAALGGVKAGDGADEAATMDSIARG